MNQDTRRRTIYWRIANVSALGGCHDILVTLLMTTITPRIHICVHQQQWVKAFLIVWYYTVVVYHVTQQQNKVLYMQHINQPECDHQEETQANHCNHRIKQRSAYQAAAHS